MNDYETRYVLEFIFNQLGLPKIAQQARHADPEMVDLYIKYIKNVKLKRIECGYLIALINYYL